MAEDQCQSDPACQAQTDRAAALAGQTRYEEALALYQRAYDRFHEPRLLLNIGRCQFRVGQAAKAMASFEALHKALPEVDPELSDRFKLFVSEAQAALTEDAALRATVPLKDELPTNPPAATGAPKDATHPSASTEDKCQEDPACQQLTEQASQLAAQTRYEEALALYRRAYERYSAPLLLLNIGRCYFRIGRSRKALEAFYSFRKAVPEADPETTTRVTKFIEDARFAAMADENSLADSNEPPPAALDPKAETVAYKIRHIQLGRPLWRIGVGAGAATLGVVLIGIGGGALAANGNCVTPSPMGMNLCQATVRPDGQRAILLYDGVGPGAALMVTGGLLVVGGVVVAALPKRLWR